MRGIPRRGLQGGDGGGLLPGRPHAGRSGRSRSSAAPVDATLSQNVRAHGLRRSRYRGLARTHVQHVLTAMTCNVARIADWIDTAPKTRRRATHFRTLCSATA
ncbi:transposase [Streptomyces sp. IB201691-2A2]|uniref:transposase n=1 Tax=Streptomyces sp. IB201691-2A2 TaxID=2561920 RepID=UPI00117C7821|nr:hypothetical protein E4K73_50045 [Streptomyces sp. IB201691-2A2]